MFQCSRSSIGYIWNVSFFHLTGPTLFFLLKYWMCLTMQGPTNMTQAVGEIDKSILSIKKKDS